MQTAKTLTLLLFLISPAIVSARVLHYGDYSVELSAEKHTTPALHVQIGDELVFGALFTDAAPENSPRINVDGADYWVGEWCAAGTYRVSGTRECIPCGVGHYCTGGSHRAACSGGAIACPGANHGADATTDLANQILTADQVNQYMPETDFSNWEEIAHSTKDPKITASNYGDFLANDPDYGQTGKVGPGTYLFVMRAPFGCDKVAKTDPFTGQYGAFNAYMAVFDKVVSYKLIYGTNMVYVYLDTKSPEFQSYDIKFPVGGDHPNASWCTSRLWANISDIENVPVRANIYLYRLK